MWNDPIVDEVRRVREQHAAAFGYDLDAICKDLKEEERKSGRRVVRLAPKRIEPEPGVALVLEHPAAPKVGKVKS